MRVATLVRCKPYPDADEYGWDPAAGEIDRSAIEQADAVVNLSGSNIAEGRWTAARKEAIRSSRIDSTRLLAETMAELDRRPRVFVCASAVGYYGDRGDEMLTEASSPGSGFLADVCCDWEAAAEPARQAGVRLVHLRMGAVLSANGGALAKMLPTFKAGFGGVIGSGKQWMSWIAIDDLVRIVRFVIEHEAIAGPVNATSPNPVTNADLTKTLGRLLHRPTFMSMPAFAVRTLFGEMGNELLLSSARVQPEKLLASGFSFNYPAIAAALEHLLHSTRP